MLCTPYPQIEQSEMLGRKLLVWTRVIRAIQKLEVENPLGNIGSFQATRNLSISPGKFTGRMFTAWAAQLKEFSQFSQSVRCALLWVDKKMLGQSLYIIFKSRGY